MKSMKQIAIILALVSTSIIAQTSQAGLAAAVMIQRTIVNQCIIQAQTGNADKTALVEKFGQEAADYLYVDGLKIYDVVVTFHHDNKNVEYACSEYFPELASIHFYQGNWNTVIDNLKVEVKRLRSENASRFANYVGHK